MSTETIFFQIFLYFAYIMFFYLIGRIFQKKTKKFLDSPMAAIFIGFIIFILVTYAFLAMPIPFDPSIEIFVSLNLAKDLLIILFIFYFYKDWINDYKMFLNKEKIMKTSLMLVGLIITLVVVLFFNQKIIFESMEDFENGLITEVNQLVDGTTNVFKPFEDSDNLMIDNFFVFNGFYYWIASIASQFNINDKILLTPDNMNSLFLLLISTTVLFSVMIVLFKHIFKAKWYEQIGLAMLMTIVPQLFNVAIKPISGVHFASIIFFISFLEILTHFSQRENNSSSLVSVGFVNLSGLFFSSVFIITNVLFLISVIFLLIFLERPFINVFKQYLVIAAFGFISLFWFQNIAISIILILFLTAYVVKFLVSYYTQARSNKKMEFTTLKNKKTIMVSFATMVGIASFAALVISPQEFIEVFSSYFNQWNKIGHGYFILFMISFVLATAYGIFNAVTYKNKKRPIEKLSIFFAFSWALFLNPVFIMMIQNVVVDQIIWILSMVYIIFFPLLILHIVFRTYKITKELFLNRGRNLENE